MNVGEVLRIHTLTPGLRIQLFPGPSLRGAGAVDENVDWTKQAFGLRRSGLRFAWIGKVRARRDDFETLARKRLTRRFQILFAAGCDRHMRAFRCERTGARHADAFTAA